MIPMQGKDNKTLLELKGTVPANMISTVELMAINKKKGIFGFKGGPLLLDVTIVLPHSYTFCPPLLHIVDVPARSYIFAPQVGLPSGVLK